MTTIFIAGRLFPVTGQTVATRRLFEILNEHYQIEIVEDRADTNHEKENAFKRGLIVLEYPFRLRGILKKTSKDNILIYTAISSSFLGHFRENWIRSR